MEQPQPPMDSVTDDPVADTDEPELSPARFDELAEPRSTAGPVMDIEAIGDIPVTLSTELGRTSITIGNLLKLNQGSVISLDRLAGEPIDVLVNGCLIAHGEVVVLEEKFGIRLTDVLSPAERVKKLV